MLSTFSIIVFVYLFFRYIYFIKNKKIKYSSALFLLVSTQIYWLSYQIHGVMVGEFYRPLLIFWLFLNFSFIFFALFSLCLDIIFMVIFLFSKKIAKIFISKKISLLLFIFSLLISGIGMYNGMRVPNINTEEFLISSQKLEKPFKIVQLTDLHLSNLLDENWISEVVKKTNEQNPDLIVITGDLADGNAFKHENTVKPLAKLKSKYGVYAVTGNHEYYSNYDEWMKLYKNNNIHFLFNESISLGSIRLIGVPDIVAERFKLQSPDMNKALTGVDDKGINILLDHRPSNFINNSNTGLIDLQLSGHTHGGMLPILEHIVAKFNDGFVAGRYENNNSSLYLSNGTGIWNGFSLRLLHDSEITVIQLLPDEMK